MYRGTIYKPAQSSSRTRTRSVSNSSSSSSLSLSSDSTVSASSFKRNKKRRHHHKRIGGNHSRKSRKVNRQMHKLFQECELVMFPVYIPLLAMSAVSAISVVFLYCKNRGTSRQGYMDVEEKPSDGD